MLYVWCTGKEIHYTSSNVSVLSSLHSDYKCKYSRDLLNCSGLCKQGCLCLTTSDRVLAA